MNATGVQWKRPQHLRGLGVGDSSRFRLNQCRARGNLDGCFDGADFQEMSGNAIIPRDQLYVRSDELFEARRLRVNGILAFSQGGAQ